METKKWNERFEPKTFITNTAGQQENGIVGLSDRKHREAPSFMKLRLLGDQYARALRVIGQDLVELLPESLTIEISGDNFVARGLERTDLSPAKTHREQNLIRKIWYKPNPPPPKAQPSFAAFVRAYSQGDIDKLDEAGRARRTGSTQKPDLHSLAERLRMIGRILDEKNGELVKLSLEGNSVMLRYRDTHGEIQSEEYSNLTLYKLQQEYYSGRCFHPGDPWGAARG